MAYHGGYAGGYADTLVPPTPPDVGYGGGYRPAVELSKHYRSVLRWRLAIISIGAAEATEPIPVRLTLTNLPGRAHATTPVELRYRADHGGTARLATRSVYQLEPGGTPTIVDPDEWIVFLP